MDPQRLQLALRTWPQQLTAPWRWLRPRFNLHLHPTLASTNDHLWQLMDQGQAASGTVVIAEQQSAGKGQRGRQWCSAPGGLYLSLLLEPEVEATTAPQLTLSAAWGLAQSLRCLGYPVQVKWPNDLVIEGRKLGGLLTQTRLQQGRISHAIIGLGLNWNNPVPATGIALAQQPAHPANPRPIEHLEALAALALLGIWQGICYRQQVGSHAFLAEYSKVLSHQDQWVSWQGNPVKVMGLSPTGDLQVQLTTSPSGTTSVATLAPGEISLGYR